MLDTITKIPYAFLISLPFALVYSFFLFKKKISVKECIFKGISFLLLVAYLLILLYLTFYNREPGSREQMDWALFSTIESTPKSMSYVVENILLFMPLAALLPINFKFFRTTWWIIPISIALSIGIEVLQHVTKRGYLQTDDVLFNVLGCTLVTIFYHIAYKCISLIKNK